MYFKSSSQQRPPAFLPGARQDGCVPLHAWNHSDGVAFSFFSSLHARRSFLSHVRWGALLLCARVNSLPRTTTPFLFFCFFSFCSHLMSPFFPAKHSQLVPGWVCTRSRRPSGAPTPLFFLIQHHQASVLQLFFFLAFQGHVFISVSSKFSRHAGGVRRCRSDWHTHTHWDAETHTTAMLTHAHIFSLLHERFDTAVTANAHQRYNQRNCGSPAGQPAFWIMQYCQRGDGHTIRWQQ